MNWSVPFRWRAQTIEAAGVRLASFACGSTAGDAPVVLLLHGLGHWSAAAWERLIAQLDGRERTILMLRFGLEGAGLTLEEIGRRLGVTRERVRQLEGRALSKLRRGHPQGGHDLRSSAGRDGFGEPESRRTGVPVPIGTTGSRRQRSRTLRSFGRRPGNMACVQPPAAP